MKAPTAKPASILAGDGLAILSGWPVAYVEESSAFELFPRWRSRERGIAKAASALPAQWERRPASPALAGRMLQESSVWVMSSTTGHIPNWKRASLHMASSPTSRWSLHRQAGRDL